jgi:NAD+ synthase (glutamine-hydrolysing)
VPPRPSLKSFTRIAILQLNPTVGDLAGNFKKIRSHYIWAQKAGADIAVTPELALSGYPPEDLLHKPDFMASVQRYLKRLAASMAGTALICGYPESIGADRIANSAAVLQSGRIRGSYRKMALPNYGVFDEQRHFVSGESLQLIRTASDAGDADCAPIGLSICEDIWDTENNYFKALAPARPHILINLSASPYERDKHAARLKVIKAAARTSGAFVVYVNLVGGQDELVFDGRSVVMAPGGEVLAEAKAFSEDRFVLDVPNARFGGNSSVRGMKVKKSPVDSGDKTDQAKDVLLAVELGLRDYVNKNGFKSVGIAMSGGIDSALVAALAVRALGKDRVMGVTLPSSVTGRHTLHDALHQARVMGIRIHELPIAELHSNYLSLLQPIFAGRSVDTTEENLQARIRGTIMMALSNKLGFLLLATGNKSEFATGYCTLYGDMAGGFAPIKDLTKTWVYRVARLINRQAGREVIPASVIRRAPTAELRPDQKDQDTLPPYAVLDRILERFIEQDSPESAILREGFNRNQVIDTVRRVVQNEYKRRQAPPGPKITSKAFGRDRRMPITQKFYA